MTQDVKAIIDVRNHFTDMFNESLRTHGMAVTYSAVVAFAAAAVHQAEHLTDAEPGAARAFVLGRWTSQFHEYLAMLDRQCDGQAKDDPLQGMKPAGMA